jgi:hypothetical protein
MCRADSLDGGPARRRPAITDRSVSSLWPEKDDTEVEPDRPGLGFTPWFIGEGVNCPHTSDADDVRADCAGMVGRDLLEPL